MYLTSPGVSQAACSASAASQTLPEVQRLQRQCLHLSVDSCAHSECALRREGNGWSHEYCRRQWSLADAEHLRYKYMNAWDAAMQRLDEEYGFLSSEHLLVSYSGDTEQVWLQCTAVQKHVSRRQPLLARACHDTHLLVIRLKSPGCAQDDLRASKGRRFYMQLRGSQELCLTFPCCMQMIVAEKGPLVFVFNFSVTSDYEGYKVSIEHMHSLLMSW